MSFKEIFTMQVNPVTTNTYPQLKINKEEYCAQKNHINFKAKNVPNESFGEIMDGIMSNWFAQSTIGLGPILYGRLTCLKMLDGLKDHFDAGSLAIFVVAGIVFTTGAVISTYGLCRGGYKGVKFLGKMLKNH